VPSITFWTRLEPFSRRDEIDAGLQARIHDPLWLLARQWQTGEFQGEDAGTPVQVRTRMERAPLARFHSGPLTGGPNLPGKPYRSELPLETLVEREAVQLAADPRRDLRLAAEAGLYFLRLLERFGVPVAIRRAYALVPDYALRAPPDEPAETEDRAGRRYLAVMAGRVPDGFRIYTALARSLRPAQGAPRLPPRPPVPAAERPKAIRAGRAFLAWFEARYAAPPAASGSPPAPAWTTDRMEYSFAVSASAGDGELALAAPEYPGGTLDWYSVDLDPALKLGVRPADPRPETVTRTVMPAPVRYPGMAADRWWQFEDGAVNFSRVEGDPDELLRLLLLDFVLIYSNDWYVLPFDAAPGAVYRLQSLVVTDAFGERTLVPHYGAVDPAKRDWRMFAPSLAASTSFGTSAPEPTNALFLPPVLAGSLHGDPLEEVLFLRDELSNLVWAVERLAPSRAGGAINRYELYHESRGQAAPPQPEEPPAEELRYRLATAVPDHWIPFQPVRIDPARPDVRLRRAAALTRESGDPAFSRPLGRILEPDRPDLSLFEEEVPRSGLRVVRQWQHARWLDGRTFLWLARRKGVGRGEGSSGLAFDGVEEA
jgi:hypothetical protein